MNHITPDQQPSAETVTEQPPSAVEVLLAHQFTVNDTAVGGLASTTEDVVAFMLAPVYAACTCGKWELSAVTVKNAETTRDEHAMHVADELRSLGLLADGAGAVEVCEMVHEEPYDFAQCLTHDTTFPLGGGCKFNGRVMWEVYADEADEQRGLKVRAEMDAEDARLDLDTLRGAVRAVLDEHPISTAAAAGKIKALLATDADPLREAQRAAWRFGRQAGVRGLAEDANPF